MSALPSTDYPPISDSPLTHQRQRDVPTRIDAIATALAEASEHLQTATTGAPAALECTMLRREVLRTRRTLDNAMEELATLAGRLAALEGAALREAAATATGWDAMLIAVVRAQGLRGSTSLTCTQVASHGPLEPVITEAGIVVSCVECGTARTLDAAALDAIWAAVQADDRRRTEYPLL